MGKIEKVKLQDKDFDEIASINHKDDISRIKSEVEKLIPPDIKIKAKNEKQKELINSIKNNEITICSGRAGSGKTFLALVYSLSLLRKTENSFKKIYLLKSVTTLKGEEIGYLKGTLDEKILPSMWSFFINMEKVISESALKQLLEKNIIRPFPIAYVRGISLDDSIIILDETQNISVDNALTIMTRIGENSKLIIIGDENQIDIKNKGESSLKILVEMFKNTEKIGVVEIGNEVSIRNPIINIIEAKYEEFLKQNYK